MNPIYLYDITFLVLFSIAIAIFLYSRRKNLVRDGILYLYKTAVGIKFLDSFSKKFPKTLKALSYAVVSVGYLLMACSIYLIVQLVMVFSKPEYVQAIKIPPIMPLIPYLPEVFKISFLPPFYFTYWIIAIAVIAIFHEGAHGVFARFFNIRIKSTGFGFLGPLLAFFVEQDDKQMQKAKIFPQLTILGAGVFANTILAIIFFFLMVGFMSTAYTPSGIIFNDYTYSFIPAENLSGINLVNQSYLRVDGIMLSKVSFSNQSFLVDSKLFNLSSESLPEDSFIKAYCDLPAINAQLKGAITEINNQKIFKQPDAQAVFSNLSPGDKVSIKTEYTNSSGTYNLEFNFAMGRDYSNSSRAVIGTASLMPVQKGIFKSLMFKLYSLFQDPLVYYKAKVLPDLMLFLKDLFWWLAVINLSVAIANMLPLGIFDGGRFFYLTILAITRKKNIAEKAFKYSTRIILALLALSMVFWAFGIF